MKDINGPGDFLAWLGGADLKILAKVPGSERTRFVQMAIVLLTTAGIGTLSMMFALHDGVHTPLAVAIIGGLVWGFIILNLDRFLVLSMGHARDWKRLLLMALPRLALAAVISMVVATPMTLRIFASDIKNEMVQVNATESQAGREAAAAERARHPGRRDPGQDQHGQADHGRAPARHCQQPAGDLLAEQGEHADPAGAAGPDDHGPGAGRLPVRGGRIRPRLRGRVGSCRQRADRQAEARRSSTRRSRSTRA